MKQEILINVAPREVRAAVVENGVLQDVLIERASRRGLIGNIYKGRVTRVLPGMQAAFVDAGLDRTAFLHASNIARVPRQDPQDGDAEPDIADCVSVGSELLVQVLKEPLGSKGARLTTHTSVASRLLVRVPTGNGVGVSVRIEDNEERERLRAAVECAAPADAAGGYIVRTAAVGASEDALHADMDHLQELWGSVEAAANRATVGDAVYEDLPLPLRVLRDLAGPAIEVVRVDSEAAFARMCEYAEQSVAPFAPRIEHYTRTSPIFDLYSVEDEIGRALRRKVPLKSGGHVVFDQTEAMTTIDVNTGAYVGHRNLEETVFRTNLEAAVAIARQLRLRNLGGIVIIDFIDMATEEHRDEVLATLSARLAGDPAKTHIMNVSPLGLVEMTRERNRESLGHVLCRACPSCSGRGYVKTAETVCYEIFREIMRQHRQHEAQELLVLARPEIVERLLDEESASVAELEEANSTPIRLQSEGMYAPDQYDVVAM